MGGNVVEMSTDVGENFLPGRNIQGKRRVNSDGQASEDLVEDGGIEGFLILEIVVKQRLVDAGRAGDGIDAGARHAFAGKLAHRGLQNGGTALFRAAAGSEAGFGGWH